MIRTRILCELGDVIFAVDKNKQVSEQHGVQIALKSRAPGSLSL